jgi:transcriptional regulator with XRE-family HTH domain
VSVTEHIEPPARTELGNLIRQARERRGMRQVDLAATVHVGLSAVSGWERGTQSPTATILPALSEALGVTFVAGPDGEWRVLDAGPDQAPQVVVIVAATAEAMHAALDRAGVPRPE